MRFPDAVTILRPAGTDEYGNPGTSWASPEETPAVGFLSGDDVFMPPTTDVQRGDRLRIAGQLYDVRGEPDLIRSPNRPVLWLVKVDRRL